MPVLLHLHIGIYEVMCTVQCYADSSADAAQRHTCNAVVGCKRGHHIHIISSQAAIDHTHMNSPLRPSSSRGLNFCRNSVLKPPLWMARWSSARF